MAKYASAFVSQAKEWLGRKESDGSHKYIIDVYNSFIPRARGYKVSYKDAWCATFVSAVAIKLGYTDIIPPECSCNNLIKLFKNLGVYIEDENRTPNVGDIVFYDWEDSGEGDNKGRADHVGIVINVSRETFDVVEGNYKNSVKVRTLDINGKYLRGFAVPKFDKEPSEQVANVSDVPNCITELAKLVIKGKYGSSPNRKDNIYRAVQAEVNRLLKG